MTVELSDAELRLIVSRLKASIPLPEDRDNVVRLAARLEALVWGERRHHADL